MHVDKEEFEDRIAELCVEMRLSPEEIALEVLAAVEVEVDPSVEDMLAFLGPVDLFKVLIHFERLDATLKERSKA